MLPTGGDKVRWKCWECNDGRSSELDCSGIVGGLEIPKGEKAADEPPMPDAAARLYEYKLDKLPPLVRREKWPPVLEIDDWPMWPAGGEVKRGGGEVIKVLP